MIMKTMCEQAKKLPDNLPFFIEQANKATHVCGKCGRMTSEKEMACKPNKISKIKSKDQIV